MERAGKTGFAWDVIHLYKYMHIYLWSALGIVFFERGICGF